MYVLDDPELTDDEKEDRKQAFARDPFREKQITIRIELGGASVPPAYVSRALYRRLRSMLPGQRIQASILVLPAQNISIVF
ncbi:MAG: hypothetical protein MJ014_00080 [Methanocorpusculum sp.]|nr:hypothetical protein [Methanocorpusculum sp.]